MKEFFEEYCIILIFGIISSIFLTLSVIKVAESTQIWMSATVEKSEYYKCIEQCEQVVGY